MADERVPEDGADLFDRWLAHRDGAGDPQARPRTYGVPRVGAHAADTADTADDADDAVPSEGDPAPHPEAEAEPAAPAQAAEPVVDFEPVVLASVRRSEERAAASRPGRRRRTTTGPDPQPTGPDDPRAGGAHRADPPAAPLPDQPPRSAAAEVLAAFQQATASDPEPTVEPPTELPTEPPAEPTTGPALGPAEESAGAPRRSDRSRPSPLAGLPTYADRARRALDRAVRGTPEEPPPPPSPPPPSPTPSPTPEPEEQGAQDGPRARSTSAYDALRAEREAAVPPAPATLPPDVDFRPRLLARRVTSLLLLLGLALTALAAWRAYDSRVQTDIGLAALLALFTGIVWAVRAGSVPTRMSLHGGLLEVRTQAGCFFFELTSAHTHLETVGTPGRRDWRVLVHRRGLAPFTITPAMVDPHEFLGAVRYYRRDL